MEWLEIMNFVEFRLSRPPRVGHCTGNKEREKRLSFLETADAGLRSSISEHKDREAALKVRVSELQQRVRVAESEREMLDKRLRDAFREGERVRKEMADRAGAEQVSRCF